MVFNESIEKIILAAGGAGLSDVVDLTVFLTDMKDYSDFNKVYNRYFNAQSGIWWLNIGPSRTTVGVAQLPSPKLCIEIKATAYFQ